MAAKQRVGLIIGNTIAAEPPPGPAPVDLRRLQQRSGNACSAARNSTMFRPTFLITWTTMTDTKRGRVAAQPVRAVDADHVAAAS